MCVSNRLQYQYFLEYINEDASPYIYILAVINFTIFTWLKNGMKMALL